MKRTIDRIFIIILLFLIALLSSCTMPVSQETESGQEESITSDEKIPRWLLSDHRSIGKSDLETNNVTILAEANNDEDETEGIIEAVTKPEPDFETTSPAEQKTPDKEQEPISENEDSDSDGLSPSEKREISRAKEALREIEKEYRTASSEERVELANRYNHIINQLKAKYGIIHENKLEEVEWWKLDRDSSPSFHHEVNPKTD